MNYDLTISSSPHIRASHSTASIMRDVCIALAPALLFSIWLYGFRVLTVVLVSVAACVFFEWAYRRMMKKDNTVRDGSAALTGLLLAMVSPPTVPYWVVVLGALFAIVVVKQLYGGIGKNFLNPALAGRAFLTASYAGTLTVVIIDGTTMATPLSYLYGENPMPFTIAQNFLGKIPGSIGEVSSLAILLGAAYLIVRKVIRWRIPACVIGSVALISFIFGHAGYGRVEWMLQNVLSGGVMFTGIFMATDYATSPVTRWGQAIYGVGIGALTMLIRYFGGFAEGCSYAILIMNLTTWALDKACHRHQFGVTKEDIAAAKAAKKAQKKEAVS